MSVDRQLNREKLIFILGKTSKRIETEFGQDDYLYCKAEEDVKKAFDVWKRRLEAGLSLSSAEVENSGIGFLIVRVILDSFPDREWIYEAYSEIKKIVER